MFGQLQKADCTPFSRTKTPFTPQLSRKGLLRLVRSLRFLVSDLIGVRLLVVRHLFGIRHGSPQFAELLADFGHLHVRVRFDNLRSLVVHEEKVRGQVSFRRVRVFHLLHFLHLLRGFRWSLGHFVYVLFLKTVLEEEEERSDEMVSLAVLMSEKKTGGFVFSSLFFSF